MADKYNNYNKTESSDLLIENDRIIPDDTQKTSRLNAPGVDGMVVVRKA